MDIKKIKQNNGTTIPIIGLGTWNSAPGEVKNAVKSAVIDYGYRHIDCASIYGNEREVGEALAEVFKSGIKREEIFITSKLWNTEHKPENVEKACRKTLEDLQLTYLDLYLIHWGLPFVHTEDLEPVYDNEKVKLENVSLQQTWQAMEDLAKNGLVKAIGVANFTAIMLTDLLSYAQIKPAMNQIELHPYLSQKELVDYCNYLGITVTAYSPLGTPAASPEGYPILLQDPDISKIAERHEKSPAQVLLRWAIQRGTVVIPKSTNEKRLKENITVFDFALSVEEMSKIDSLNKNLRYVDPVDWWAIPYFK